MKGVNGYGRLKIFPSRGYERGCACVNKIKLKRARVLRFVEGAWIKEHRWVCVPEMTSLVYLK